MKKRFILILFFGWIWVGCGCGAEREIDWTETEHEVVNDVSKVMMDVKDGTVTPTGLTVILENSADKEWIYSEDFLLEKNVDGVWRQIPVETSYGFEDIGYVLEPSSESEWSVDWEWLYGSLNAGTYRIVKSVLDSDQQGHVETYDLAAEFTVE